MSAEEKSTAKNSRDVLLDHPPEYEAFFSPYAALSAQYIISNVHHIPKNKIEAASQACQILLQYFLQNLCKNNEYLGQKQLMTLIRSLSIESSGSLHQSDIIGLTNVLKSAKVPPFFSGLDTHGPEESKESRRAHADPSSSILEQLMTPIYELPAASKSEGPIETINKDGDTTIIHIPDPGQEIKSLLMAKNLINIQRLNGGEILLDVCLALPSVSHYNTLLQDALDGRGLTLPSCIAETTSICNSYKTLLHDFGIVSKAIGLPIMEPFSPERLQKLATVVLSCLYGSVAVAIATGIQALAPISGSKGTIKDDDCDSSAESIVEMALETYNSVSETIAASTRAGGHVLQNLHMIGSWLILGGLRYFLNLNLANLPDKGKDPSRGKSAPELTPTKTKDSTLQSRNVFKIQQGFGALCVALSSHAVKIMIPLLGDLRLEGDEEDTTLEMEILRLENITRHNTAWERVSKLTKLGLTSLLFGLASVSYRKACMLKKIQKHPLEGDAFSTSDSNTYYEDDFSSSESSDDDDEDSEPILGQWFEETIAPHDTTRYSDHFNSEGATSTNSHAATSHGKISEIGSLVPERGEPHGFIKLSSKIFGLLNTYFLNADNKPLHRYFKNSLEEPQMVIIAGIIKDLDKETSRSDTGTISVYFGAVLGQLYDDFSGSLARFMHNVLATEMLSEPLQNMLLVQLGISPWTQDYWPFQVHFRSLSVLAQVLLLRQQREKDIDLRSESEATCALIWHNFLHSLKKAVLNTSASAGEEYDDINVEHAQLLLFLFHNLQLMQKKSILLLTAQTILDVSSIVAESVMSDMQMVYCSRLLHLFEYMMKNLYDTPSSLIEQVNWNLFSAHAKGQAGEKENNQQMSCRAHFTCKELEDNFEKQRSSEDMHGTIRPKFYYLMPVDINHQDIPKLDGFASSFMLGSSDVLNYKDFYEAVMLFTTIGGQCHRRKMLSTLGACTVHYCFATSYRLLLCLPPSVESLEGLTQESIYSEEKILHALIWVPRTNHKVFSGWLKDALVKQGLVTHKAEMLLKNVSKFAGNVNFDIQLAKYYFNKQIQERLEIQMLPEQDDVPQLLQIIFTDSLLAKIQVAMDECFSKVTNDSAGGEMKEMALELVPLVVQLTKNYLTSIRWSLLHQRMDSGEFAQQQDAALANVVSVKANSAVMHIASTRAGKLSTFTSSVAACLPPFLRHSLDHWNGISVPVTVWRNDFLGDIIPSESYITSVLFSHLSSLSTQEHFSVKPNLKRLLQSLVRFAGELIVWCVNSKLSRDIVGVMLPMLLDATTENLADYVTLAIERIIGPPESDDFLRHLYEEALEWIYVLLIEYSSAQRNLDEQIYHECLKLMESMLDKVAGRKALEKFFGDNEGRGIIDILLSAAYKRLSPTYGTYVLKFFSRLFQQTEKSPGDRSLERLAVSFNRMSKLSRADSDTLQHWLSKVITGHSSLQENEDSGSMKENRLLLQNLTMYIVKENSGVNEEVANAILSALLPMGSQILSPASEGIGFSELMVIMDTLAGAGSGTGHVQLFKSSTHWLELCNKYLAQKDVLEKLEENIVGGKHQIMMESACYLLSYVAEIMGALKLLSERTTQSARSGTATPPCDGELHQWDADSWTEELGPDEDDSPAEDSDEDSLCNKLCTFTMTQKEFANQHWYHCHSCKMIDGVGVCTVCAKVCHKDHDVTYAKYGSFFCDCGAKEDGSCQALVKRSPQSATTGGSAQPASFLLSSSDVILPSSLRRRPSSPTPAERSNNAEKKGPDESLKQKQALALQLEDVGEQFIEHLASSNVASIVLGLLVYLMPAVVRTCQRNSSVGNSSRAQLSLQKLHKGEKSFEQTDQLMVPTLGSQEGAFENVRMTYSGEQGQTIRQLITAHAIHRVAMCCLTGKRQHLAVSHEKGKITLLQLAALLKQADSSKRKLTLTRLGSAPVPFTVLSIVGNPCNEDFLAVCGLKDCHVLTFTSTGSIADHLVLHLQLESSNYIIKAVWLPGHQAKLAVVTADFVKIYDLAQDILSPQFYFLLPGGKIRDCCFVFSEDSRPHLLIMSTAGHVYYQPMQDESSAKHGPFYVTNILEIRHPDVKDTNGTVNGGGVSIYYSHSLQLLFFSYTIGKSFIAPLRTVSAELTTPIQIQIKNSNGNNSNSGSNAKACPQPLCQWSEVPHHPGLVLAQMQTSNNPFVLMVKPDVIMTQEIKFLGAKSKITDMVAMRHPTSTGEMRTTLILLCEDGSLRIYMANPEQTGFWLTPSCQVPQQTVTSRTTKKKKVTKVGHPVGSVAFPVDFFEHCNPLNDIEFGGNDVLQIYNVQQIKHRLNTTGMYIASTKPAGFTIEVSNSDNSMVMTGVRVMVGSQDIQRAPSCIEIFGRTQQVTLARNRWYDFAFTHEEALAADKKISIYFGASTDPSNVTVVDSIKVYGKTKEAFGWPDENEDATATVSAVAPSGPVVCVDSETIPAAPLPLTPLDKLIGSSLEVLEGCLSVGLGTDEQPQLRASALELATQLLTLPVPSSVQQHVKAVLAVLHPSRVAYTNHKDQALLTYVVTSLSEDKTGDHLDGESFYRLVSIVRGVASARPLNLVKFAESQNVMDTASTSSEDFSTDTPSDGRNTFVQQLTKAFWRLHSQSPRNPALSPVSQNGLLHVDATVQALVEVVHAFNVCDLETVSLATKMYIPLLMCEDTAVSFAAKQALIRVLRSRPRRRKVQIPSPPHCSTPGEAQEQESELRCHPMLQVSPQAQSDNPFEIIEPAVLLSGEASASPSLEALISGGAGFHLLDIPPDADDETMVELAIALSLQDQSARPESLGPQRTSSLEGGHYSDTTASANASDDEGSTAATDGSTLRTSPAEQGGSAESESGGSGVDSITGEPNVSGRSSAYGDNMPEGGTTGARSEAGSAAQQETEGSETDDDRFHTLRISLLEKLLQYFQQVQTGGGVNAIPFMQVLLMLTSDLDGEDERDRAVLDTLLSTVIGELKSHSKDVEKIATRSPEHEVLLIVMRFLSIMMSRVKGSKYSGECSNFCSTATAQALLASGTTDFCLQILCALSDFWKSYQIDENSCTVGNNLLKPHPPEPPPDMSPFFLRQYVKGHANDVFEAYPQLLTEMVLRLPYQMKRIVGSTSAFSVTAFGQEWFTQLCEYMMMHQTPFVRRQVRKLLLFLSGSKDKYRQLRDFHSLESHLQSVRTICRQGGFDGQTGATLGLPYDLLISTIEHLKACSEIATSRTQNWQKFCDKDDTVLPFLIHVSFLVNEGISSIILQLLQSALCSQQSTKGSPSKQKEDDADDIHCKALAQQVNRYVDDALLSRFLEYFLLESNLTSVRWQAHSLIYHLFKNSNSLQQENILNLLWKLWPCLSAYGRKAAQFVDLLGYFTLTSSPTEKEKEYVEHTLQVLRGQNQLLMNHPNFNIYNNLQGLVEFDGFYLESEPCLVCNNPEVPFTNVKLSAVKVDSRFTTTTQIVKLIGSHSIAKITLRIGDLKRSKMVRTMNVFYNNRSVQSVVELKNRPSIWHRAKRCVLAAGQTELKIEFPLPIVACNLMIEYSDFYENIQASSETLQCPRCSASVPANPGVCANCGENVFQCHKCRAINYDEKDPFLCNSCGFCKYAKFDYTLTAKSCCAVCDPIENEEDRKKAVSTINNLLEKADRVYKQLIGNKPALELLLLRIHEHGMSDHATDDGLAVTSGASVPSNNVNRAIQQLAQRYCSDCKASFDELSKIVQRVLASRKELVEYERQQQEGKLHFAKSSLPVSRHKEEPTGRCYGCSSSAVEHCITLMRALATDARYRQMLCAQGLVRELVGYNLRRGAVRVRHEVRQLLCLLTRDNPRATADLNLLLMEKIATTLKSYPMNPDLSSAIRHEVALLASSLQKDDSCWEQRLRCLMQLFLMGVNAKNPVVMESITLPCLQILQILIKPDSGKKTNMDSALASRIEACVCIDLQKWLSGEPRNTYRTWRQSGQTCSPEGTMLKSKEELRSLHLMEKYGQRWLEKTIRAFRCKKLLHSNWLWHAMFSSSSRAARTVACSLVDALCQVPCRKKVILDLFTGYLDDLGNTGESATEFLELFQNLIRPLPWKYYLTLKGLLPHLGELITKEIDYLIHLEATTLSSDLSQGYTLKMLTELLASFIEVDNIRQRYKSRLVGCVLNGYLSLKKLVVQRTKLIDETQEKLLELLEDMTTGTESETEAFISICVETSKRYNLDDMRTPLFIFERLCSVIYPEENDTGEFFMTLEKDPQQEDFLQGRMIGNPYSSNENGMSPLMRDIKNKICRDCELVALLEDDNGMELLVGNKIISLDLPVKEVYKKIWCSENSESEAMRIVYRMRGLLGDATEEFIQSLDSKDSEEVDNEDLYKMAGIMSRCGGLEVMLQRLDAITDLARGQQLLAVLLKLFGYCIKVKQNRQKLVDPSTCTISKMLGTLRTVLSVDNPEFIQGSPGGPTVAEQLLRIMEVVMLEASALPPEEYAVFCETCGTSDDVASLLSSITKPVLRHLPALQQLLMRVVPFLTLGNQDKMETLVDYFQPYLNFNKFDFEHTTDDDLHLECFCMLTAGIECNLNGSELKDLIVSKGVVQNAIEYLTVHSPTIKSALLAASEEWKEFTSKPALKYVLRLLTGQSHGHKATQLLVSADCIPIIHRLEQVSSDERVGSLAENLMEAIKEDPDVAEKIEDVRKQTRSEKKRLAMAMREKQLGALGMMTNEKGQVTARRSLLKNVEELGDEAGLVCVICREGYKFQPTKVLGIYTFTKRCNQDDFENRPRKTPGYTTVTHFNVVHVDCHMAAVRHARGRDEWESAVLQNANTRCNGLLPLWGPQVPESAFASCLARHNTYLQESTGHRDVTYGSTVHDLKLLLLRFATESSFSEDSSGGGPQSNTHLIPYMIHMALYVINTTRNANREEKNLEVFLEAPAEKWIPNCFEVEGVYYWMAMCILIFPPSKFKQHRQTFLSRLILLAHARHATPQGATSLSADCTPEDYSIYKAALVYYGLVESIYSYMFKNVVATTCDDWPIAVAEYIRHNDQVLLDAGNRMLQNYEESYVSCQSFAEFCDIAGFLEDIPDPDGYLAYTLNSAI